MSQSPATGHQQTVSRETLINCAIEDIKTYSSAIGMARNQTDIDSYKRLRDSAEEALREAIAKPSETRQKLYPEMAKPSAASETAPPEYQQQLHFMSCQAELLGEQGHDVSANVMRNCAKLLVAQFHRAKELDHQLQALRSATRPSIEAMVDRFLSWKLPQDFSPDGGISFTPYFNVEYNAKHGKPPQRHEPIGTNLLTATQARAMLEHVLGGEK